MAQDAGQEAGGGGSPIDEHLRGLVFSAPGGMNQILHELKAQTDRGLAVLGGAYLEWQVRAVIRTKLTNWDLPRQKGKPLPMGAKIFGGDDTAGELGFLDQCRMAYCLDLIGPAGFRDLERIARIRNQFAHHMEVNSFSGNPKVKKLCEELESLAIFVATRDKHTEITEPRWRFFQAIQALWTMLLVSGLQEKTKPNLADIFPNFTTPRDAGTTWW